LVSIAFGVVLKKIIEKPKAALLKLVGMRQT
jgi:hypothetical protein